MSDTPETDAAWARFSGNMELLQDVIDLSRRLERERNEARKRCGTLDGYWQQAEREFQILLESTKFAEVSIQMVDGAARPVPWDGTTEAEKLRQERDQWRECAEELHAAVCYLEPALVFDGDGFSAERGAMRRFKRLKEASK